jgi:hypothetical protein
MAHWRDTFKPARFFFLDARAGVPIVATLLHVRVWTVTLTLLIVIAFYILERRGLSVPSAFRAFRAWIIGDARPPLPAHKIRGPIDHARRPVE